MSHQYDAHMDNGDKFTVTTSRHHDDHTDDEFAKHLLDVIKGSISGVVSGVIVRFAYKGRK
ncbi:MAG: hypothetical protein Q7U20_07840 [Caulobacter sp.]|nr:hypothetical protein [Caulobacter sp.]